MEKYVVFGAGYYGRLAIDLIGKENIYFFIDNNSEKQKNGFEGFSVLSVDEAVNNCGTNKVLIAVDEKFAGDIKKQLQKNGISKYATFSEVKSQITKEKLLNRTDYISIYKKAISWINNNSISGEGIINNTEIRESYPEVTGYYIPTLLRWGYKNLAIDYAKWLCSIQHKNGSWYDTENQSPYIFDSAQILKGLIAIRDYYPYVDDAIIKGCNWILSNMTDEGRLVSPLKDSWGDGKTFSELIHTYCISPIRKAGEILSIPEYLAAADKITEYYTTVCRNEILNFNLLSHFYAYVMEAMIDIDHEELAREAMDKIATIQKESGAVPAYNNCDWVCSTGLFQLALVWFRLGDTEKGNKAFKYACKLQNESGGWYGSYISEENSNENNTYFPSSEISWANKYYLDALYYKNLAQFEEQAYMFGSSIDRNDGRYNCIKNLVSGLDGAGEVLDIGCGKGRYLINLCEDYPDKKYYAVDLSKKVMEYLSNDSIVKKEGSLTNIPFEDDKFDLVYSCEALEHAVDISSAVRELCRVTRSKGKIAVIDKSKDKLGYFDIEEYEQWFDEHELKDEMLKYCSDVRVEKEVSFDNTPANGLFYCWIGIVK